MCISSSSNQADEVYTNVYTKIVVFFEPSTNRTKVMLTYQEKGALPPSLRSSPEVYTPQHCRVAVCSTKSV